MVQFFQDRGLAGPSAASQSGPCLPLGLLKLTANLPPPDLPSACPTPSPGLALFISHPDPSPSFQPGPTDALPLVSFPPSLLQPQRSQSDSSRCHPHSCLNPPLAKKPIPIPLRGITEPHLPGWLTSSLSLPSPRALFQSQVE